jgi:hypothetical protein
MERVAKARRVMVEKMVDFMLMFWKTKSWM